MNIEAWNILQIRNVNLPVRTALIRFADHADLFQAPKGTPIDQLDILCHDAAVSYGRTVAAPDDEQSARIGKFLQRHRETPNIIIQCQAGIGRSRAVQAAAMKMLGYHEYLLVLRQGTHNRRLYQLILKHFGMEPEVEPSVTMVVRLKYAPDRLQLFMLSMRQQRYENWNVVLVTDGPMPEMREALASMNFPEGKVRLIETPEVRGYWGHPWRQMGIDAADGEYIGLSNDDNYYVPGYLEQMINGILERDSEIAFCSMLHRHSGWETIEIDNDVGSWIARSSLVKSIPWPGNGYFADAEYAAALRNKARNPILVKRALFVKN